jgi:multidrug resistance protein, MATE family
MRQPIVTEIRALWQLSWPLLIGQLANVGMGVVEVAMAGHASAQDLAGVSLGVAIWTMLIISLMGLMMSVNPIIAHHVGAKEFEQVPHIVRQGLWKALGVGVLAMGMSILSAEIFNHMELEPVVREIAQGFVIITSLALPAFTCYRVLYGYSTCLNQTKPLMVMAVLTLGLNVVVNALLVFGLAGFPRLGGIGCAWATVICVWFNLLALLWWMRRSPAYRSTWPFGRFEAPQRGQLGTLFKLGTPIGITYFAESSAFSLIALLVAEMGSVEVAAHQIALSFTSLVFMVPLSLGVALLTRVGQSLGSGKPDEARFRAWVGVGVSLLFALFSASGMALFNTQIAYAYTNDTSIALLAAQLLFLAAIFQFSDATQVVTSCAIRGYKVTHPPMVLHLIAFWLISLPLGYILAWAPAWLPWQGWAPMGAQGFWAGLIVGLTVAAIGLVVMLRWVSLQHLHAKH